MLPMMFLLITNSYNKNCIHHVEELRCTSDVTLRVWGTLNCGSYFQFHLYVQQTQQSEQLLQLLVQDYLDWWGSTVAVFHLHMGLYTHRPCSHRLRFLWASLFPLDSTSSSLSSSSICITKKTISDHSYTAPCNPPAWYPVSSRLLHQLLCVPSHSPDSELKTSN